MLSYGIMQGRLTPPKGRGIQFFPFDNWEKEFYAAAELGLDEIEWIFDLENYEENPLWTPSGINIVKKVISESGISIKSVCFDYFMRVPFFKTYGQEKEKIYKENIRTANKVLDFLADIDGCLLEIPLVDNSSVKTSEERKNVIAFIADVSQKAEQLGLKIGVETDFAPGEFISFLEEIERETGKYAYANYDSGNSSGLGFDAEEEINSLRHRVYNVHIKDRLYQGATVQLGTGNADFDKVFSALKRNGYKNSFILQAARGIDGMEIQNIAEQIKFVRKYAKKYGLGE